MEQLYDTRGQRKYLTQHERDRFLKARPIHLNSRPGFLRSPGRYRLPDLGGAGPNARMR